MAHFTEEQLKELEVVFKLERNDTETLPVRDGRVGWDDMVWWRCDSGPEHALAGGQWSNIRDYPEAYQINKPSIGKVIYLD